jgi:multimeric flavodoxin WrbA
MKILVISASPRKKKSQTLVLAEALVRGMGPGVKTETVHLCEKKIGFCRSCERCHEKILKCPVKDDVPAILRKMLAADGIVFASPNYINQVTAAMKALFDRASHFIHCKRLEGKYTAGVVSSGGGRDEDVLGYIKYFTMMCGGQYASGVAAQAPVPDAKKQEAAIAGASLRNSIKEKRQFPDQLRVLIAGKTFFRPVVMSRKDLWKEEYKYWQKQGWFE